MVHDPQRFPHHPVWSECRCLGWHALPPTLQCCASHVYTDLRRHQLSTEKVVGDRFTDSERALLRHRLWSGTMALPRPILVGMVESRRRRAHRNRHPTTCRHTSRMVQTSRLRTAARRGRCDCCRPQGPRCTYSRQGDPRPTTYCNPRSTHKELEDGFRHLDECRQYIFSGCSLLLHVALQSHQQAVMGHGALRRNGLHCSWRCRHPDVARGQKRQEGRRCACA